ncbi:hypothetical protein I8748_14305 [Nostoc sp. CENA67]|uniref:Uncharacterized protein n=1 Tax=Amazonocrinis nigriterrae CENA67 TaxID=2794033 RepID=A0A8J7L7F3_9NOST|nr:hypothetical protein [Amazonocrinis nigriterrae]MBH8563344.1 hypothetical protein [Amazonocrinis nigriterrae CENA67]
MYKQKSKPKIRQLSPSNYTKNREFNSKSQIFTQAIKQLCLSWQACLPIMACLIVLGWGYVAVAQTPATGLTTAELQVAFDTLWVAIAAFLVFFITPIFVC